MSAVQRVNHRARLKSINAFEAIAFTSKQSLRWAPSTVGVTTRCGDGGTFDEVVYKSVGVTAQVQKVEGK